MNYTTKETVSTLRNELKAQFPKAQVKVKGVANKTMGDSIDVSWVGGPSRDEMEAAVIGIVPNINSIKGIFRVFYKQYSAEEITEWKSRKI